MLYFILFQPLSSTYKVLLVIKTVFLFSMIEMKTYAKLTQVYFSASQCRPRLQVKTSISREAFQDHSNWLSSQDPETDYTGSVMI